MIITAKAIVSLTWLCAVCEHNIECYIVIKQCHHPMLVVRLWFVLCIERATANETNTATD